jgi:hypothetical protein
MRLVHSQSLYLNKAAQRKEKAASVCWKALEGAATVNNVDQNTQMCRVIVAAPFSWGAIWFLFLRQAVTLEQCAE